MLISRREHVTAGAGAIAEEKDVIAARAPVVAMMMTSELKESEQGLDLILDDRTGAFGEGGCHVRRNAVAQIVAYQKLHCATAEIFS
jgi:hypothetical protein